MRARSSWREAELLGQAGYQPVAQSWADGRYHHERDEWILYATTGSTTTAEPPAAGLRAAEERGQGSRAQAWAAMT